MINRKIAVTTIIFFSYIIPALAEESHNIDKNPFSIINSQKIPFTLNGKSGIDFVPKIQNSEEKDYETIGYRVWSAVECRVNWNQHCDGTETIVALPGYQVCASDYRVTAKNERSGYEVKPGDFFPNDIESPARFRSVSYRVWAKGSGSIFDQYGSIIRLEDIGMIMIDSRATNEDRFRAGCWMPIK